MNIVFSRGYDIKASVAVIRGSKENESFVSVSKKPNLNFSVSKKPGPFFTKNNTKLNDESALLIQFLNELFH